jgi:predicted nucleic acid-binding protein
VIYLDSSVVLAHLFTEHRTFPPAVWQQSLVSSRLLEYELWTRLHARDVGASRGDQARKILSLVDLIELTPAVLARALKPFSVSVRTLDALHLATIEFLRGRHYEVTLASFDGRLLEAARALGVSIYGA